MDMMEIRRRVLINMGVKLPDFIKNIEGGTFVFETAPNNGEVNVQLSKITDPKVIIIYSNDFNLYDAKTDKPMLGAFGAIWIKPHDNEEARKGGSGTILSDNSYYFVNWGDNTNGQNGTPRKSRTETRGVRVFNPSNSVVWFFGMNSAQSDYDFKLGVEYHWLVIE